MVSLSIAEITNEREEGLTNSSLLPIENILNTLDNDNVSSRDEELVHLNDYYFFSLAFFSSTVILLCFSLSHSSVLTKYLQFLSSEIKWDCTSCFLGVGSTIENYGCQAERIA